MSKKGQSGSKVSTWTKAEKRCFITNRKCLQCDKQVRSKWPSICKNCKRKVDYIEHYQDDYSF